MTVTTAPPIPAANRLDPYLAGLRQGELRVTRCTACGLAQFPPRAVCPGCAAVGAAEWVTVSGRGTVWSFCVFHKAYLPGPAPRPPYNVVVVRLDEGPKLISNLPDVAAADLRVGLAVTAVFPEPGDGPPLIRFRPTEQEREDGT